MSPVSKALYLREFTLDWVKRDRANVFRVAYYVMSPDETINFKSSISRDYEIRLVS